MNEHDAEGANGDLKREQEWEQGNRVTTDATDPTNAKNGPETPDSDEATIQPPHDAIGAYVLDALPEDERLEFERNLEESPELQREVARLLPVVDLLSRALEGELDEAQPRETQEDGEAQADLSAPSPDLRNRILAAAGDDEAPVPTAPVATPPTPSTTEPEPVEPPSDDEAYATWPDRREQEEEPEAPAEEAPSDPVATPIATADRPRGRIRPGVVPGGAVPLSGPWAAVDRIGYSRLAAAILALIAVSTLIWALGLQGRVDDQRSEIVALQAQIEELRGQATASVFTLVPTGEGPPTAHGTLFALPTGEGTLQVRNLEPLSPDQAYQLWYIADDEDPRPGATFQVDEEGVGYLSVPADALPYELVAVTAEPSDGSPAPTSDPILIGEAGIARG